jgi:hypothetical protein
MRGAVISELRGTEQTEALAFLDQGRDFYEVATGRLSTNPLLLYYSFLNLGKALIRVRGFSGDLDRAVHGLRETHEKSTDELEGSSVVVEVHGKRASIFPELIDHLGFDRPKNLHEYRVTDLLPQVVVGHRLWRETADRAERFIGLDEIEIVNDPDARELWVRLYVPSGDLNRYGIGKRQLLKEGGIAETFRYVEPPGKPGRDLEQTLCLEQLKPVGYGSGYPTDKALALVDPLRRQLWRIITSGPEQGYRKYYLHLSRPADAPRLPQVASLWALMFYFGSVVRYRPHVFGSMSTGKYGAFVAEFIAAQPEQLLYMLASEMCRREIAKPAIA